MKDIPPNEYRRRGTEMGRYSSTDADGMNGAFSIPLKGFGHRIIANCIVSDGRCEEDAPAFSGWEHVSVHVMEYGRQRIPTWKEMCAVKDIFWNDDEWVVQYHPAKDQYVNDHACVLHL